MSSLLEPSALEEQVASHGRNSAEGSDRSRSPVTHPSAPEMSQPVSRTPTSAEIDAVIAAAIANAPPPPPPPADFVADMNRSSTPLMTNLLPSAVGVDGRVNLFVGNLPYRVRWQDLKDLFRKAGTVLRADVSLGPDNRSRGYGTVLMGSREDAARAIDRYNGYTWQTRTLEVRPDRLPPEYEPQSHQVHHNAPRPPMFNYHSVPGNTPSPFLFPGHLTPHGGPGWLPGQIPGQRSFSGQGGHHGMLMPGMGVSPGGGPMSSAGSSPMPGGQSPSSMFGSVSLPLSVQNTGGPVYPPLAASPLAGSLSAGSGPAPPHALDAVRRESSSHLSHSVSPDPIAQMGRSTSPGVTASMSRSASGQGPLPSSTSPDRHADGATSRAPPPGHLGTLPPPLFAGVKAVIPPMDAGKPAGGVTSGSDGAVSPPKASGPPIASMEGLAHQGMGLGPPETLHDRVIFVSNLPLSMQWQDLKDLLRPAGTIIRADVATDPNGRPRGFGTALFAVEADAARAVEMFNNREIGGFRIRAHLERDSHPFNGADHDPSGYRQHPQNHLNGSGPSSQSSRTAESNSVPSPLDTAIQSSNGPSPADSPVPKLPWSLNTSLQHQTPVRASPGTPNFRQHHHPGPISMPAFPPIGDGNPTSPFQSRNLPPMTPSMPGFVFNAYPETPPIHPHFMSPGIGPFSPGIPVTSPTGFQYNPFLNAAPGAPVNRFPQQQQQQHSGSAALGTPTTQAFPNGQGPIHQFAGPPGQPLNISQTLAQGQSQGGQDYFPNVLNQPTAPDTPTPRVSSRAPAVSPLNGKDRLAPSDPDKTGAREKELVNLASSLSLNEVQNGTTTPDSPSEIRRSASGLDVKDLSNNSNRAVGRASMDEQRLGDWEKRMR
ncbi:hypothetical protein CI109_107334 [Kwoniella shandongensis]|uniref:Uncharacterized protein n=1 Tax=Kwoniella shandongensis TaxID=1734106 RepID=A0A5M6BXB5_9TREE|nr:uncharacterized protein CI109_004738 [Kwoniella shandongensis]KAA5526961.1 hypothetical protein CI109_004738 [Kwoniella shandongensis]